MYDAREAIDVITLQQRLKDKQLLEQIGGIAYLSQLAGLAFRARRIFPTTSKSSRKNSCCGK